MAKAFALPSEEVFDKQMVFGKLVLCLERLPAANLRLGRGLTG